MEVTLGTVSGDRSGFFWPADPDARRHAVRRRHAGAPWLRARFERCRHLAAICVPLWEVRAGHRDAPPARFSRFPSEVPQSSALARISARLDQMAARWSSPRPYAEGYLRFAHRRGQTRYRVPARRQPLPRGRLEG
jgi:hypothetical protein